MITAPSTGYEDWYTIRTHEIDFHKVLTIPSLMMLMQEASMHNALNLKISIWDEGMDNLSWVLLRKVISVKRLPTLGDRVKVITYPAGFERIFAYRDFWVYDEDENEIAHASSTWTLLDLVNRKVSRIPQRILDLGIPDVGHRLPKPPIKIPVPNQYNEAYTYKIRHYDLDWNHHVNNIVLSKLMLQAVSEVTYETKRLTKYSFQIKAECYQNEVVTIGLKPGEEGLFYHELQGNDGRIVAIGTTEWA